MALDQCCIVSVRRSLTAHPECCCRRSNSTATSMRRGTSCSSDASSSLSTSTTVLLVVPSRRQVEVAGGLKGKALTKQEGHTGTHWQARRCVGADQLSRSDATE